MMISGLSFSTLLELAQRAWGSLTEGLSAEDLLSPEGLTSLARFTTPVAPFNRPEVLAPLVGLAGVVLGVLLAGAAVGSLATLLISILALALVLTRVFGVSLELVSLSA